MADKQGSATVERANGSTFLVKNLGWLLRHASEVELIVVRELADDRATMNAYGFDWHYRTEWGSFRLAKEWVQRPSLAHAKVEIHAGPVLS